MQVTKGGMLTLMLGSWQKRDVCASSVWEVKGEDGGASWGQWVRASFRLCHVQCHSSSLRIRLIQRVASGISHANYRVSSYQGYF